MKGVTNDSAHTTWYKSFIFSRFFEKFAHMCSGFTEKMHPSVWAYNGMMQDLVTELSRENNDNLPLCLSLASLAINE